MKSPVTISFAYGRHAQAIRVESQSELGLALSRLGLTENRPVLVVIGGASLICEKDLQRLRCLFVEMLAPLAQELNLIVADGGTDAGVMRLMGQAREQNHGTFPLVGVSPVGLVKLPHAETSSTELTDLESHHTHFFLVPGEQWGDESRWLAKIASQIAGAYPSVTVLINGGSIALVDAMENLRVHRPLLVIQGSGRLADEIAK
ncbi:MAG: hypothetical protein ACKOX2_00305, partial [Microcystaceae cyanobacterium]